jgi:ATP-binding cassette subfamily F protein 3
LPRQIKARSDFMIRVENLEKSFAGQKLFDGANFKIGSRERVGLVGRNGHGKTTLFRMIMGEESCDEGVITIPKNYRIGIVQQSLAFTKRTVLEEGMKGLPADRKHNHWEVEKILAGLGYSQSDMQRCPREFSGGFQVRLNLAKTIVSEPDLLLLDEPTNYLDITSIRWIEKYLVKWPHEIMLITHDRGFMDKVVTHVLGIHRKKIRKISGSTEKYYTQIAQDEEVYEKTRLNDERRKKEINQFISRFRAKARLANMVQSRIKTIEKMEKKDKLDQLKTLEFSFRSKPFRGKHVLRAEHQSFSYDPKVSLIKDLSFSVNSGDRICIVGKNGKGKTTLLKILAGVLKSDAGSIVYNPNIDIGLFEQTNVQTLIATRTVEEEIAYAHEDIDRQRARDICGAMMFEGDAALKKIGVLSGGEKSRVLLGKILAVPVNLLLLDEPTNHLDMDSCDALLAALDSFQGTVIIVTHNEMFLHALADRLVVFQNEQVHLFEGSYQQFLDKEGWSDEVDEQGDMLGKPEDMSVSAKRSKKDIRRIRSEIVVEKSRKIKPLDHRIKKVEEDIDLLEKNVQMLNEAMINASKSNDGRKIAEISQEIHKGQGNIECLFAEMEQLYHDKEQAESYFNKKLKEIEP